MLNIIPRAADRILAAAKPDTKAVAQLVTLLLTDEATAEPADRSLQLLTARIRSGEITGESRAEINDLLAASLNDSSERNLTLPSTLSAIELAASLGDNKAIQRARQLFYQTDDEPIQLRLLHAVISGGDASALSMSESLLADSVSIDVRRKAVQAIGRLGSDSATAMLLRYLPMLPADVQPAAIEALTDREDSAIELLNRAIAGTLT